MKKLKWVIPIVILLLIWSSSAFGTYRLFGTARSTNTSSAGPTQVSASSNIYKLTYTTSDVCSLLGAVSGLCYDTTVIFPVGSTLSAAWENSATGYDMSGYKNFHGWVNLYDTTGMTDTVLNSYDTVVYVWQTSIDKKYWTSLDSLTKGDTVTLNNSTGSFSVLPWTGQCAAALAAPRYPNQSGAPEIGPYLRILATYKLQMVAESVTYLHRKQNPKYRVTLFLEK